MSDTVKLTLPYKFDWRSYQREMWEAMVHQTVDGKLVLKRKRGCCVWHRRSGKGKNGLNFMATMAAKHRVGTYYYFLPTYAQAKKTVWDAIDANGMKVLDHIPQDLRAKPPNETEMQIELVNGSIIQFVGVDKIDSIVGTNPVGVVFDEYSLQNPRGWNFVQPILAENGGWALFLYTPRGRNHGWKLFDIAQRNPEEWYSALKTVYDTRRDAPGENNGPVVTNEQIERDKRDGMSDELVEQEYFCSFAGLLEGSILGDLLEKAEKEGRILDLPIHPLKPVVTWWDLGRGVGNDTSIWFLQKNDPWLDFVDFLSAPKKGLPEWARELQRLDYLYDQHVMPHDIEVVEYGSSIKRKDTARKLGIKPIKVAPKLPIAESVNAARAILPFCRFHRTRCEVGIHALRSWMREYDDVNHVFKKEPKHDWASNPADAFRTGAVLQRLTGWEGGGIGRPRRQPDKQQKADGDYDIWDT